MKQHNFFLALITVFSVSSRTMHSMEEELTPAPLQQKECKHESPNTLIAYGANSSTDSNPTKPPTRWSIQKALLQTQAVTNHDSCTIEQKVSHDNAEHALELDHNGIEDEFREAIITGDLQRAQVLSDTRNVDVSENYKIPAVRPNTTVPTLEEQLNLMKLLLEHGSNVNSVDASGRSILHTELDNNCRPRIVELLIKYGADVNQAVESTNIKPLQLAKNQVIVQILRNAGAN
jgi:hypothetical protein